MATRIKEVVVSILKYILIFIVIVVLTGYLAVKNKLPAVVPQSVATEIKNIVLNILKYNVEDKHKVISSNKIEKKEAFLGPSLLYKIFDFVLLDRRYSTFLKFSSLNSQRISDTISEYKVFIDAILLSDFAKEFFLETGKPDREFPLRAYLDKFLFENDLMIGYEIFDEQGRFIAPGRYKITLEKDFNPPSVDDTFFKSYIMGEKTFISFTAPCSIKDRKTGFLRLIYSGKIFEHLALPTGINSFFIITDDRGVPLCFSGNSDMKGILELYNLSKKSSDTFRFNYDGKKWIRMKNSIGGGLNISYFFVEIPTVKIVINSGLFLVFIFILIVFVKLITFFIKRLKYSLEGEKREDIISGTVTEVVKTLKTTAEVAEKITESSREELLWLKQKIENFEQRTKNLPVEDKNEEIKQDDWEIMSP